MILRWNGSQQDQYGIPDGIAGPLQRHDTNIMRRTCRLPFLGLLLTTVVAAQSGQTKVSAALDSADVIAWRKVGRGDFRGDRPPGAFAFGTGAIRPVAVTCAYVVASPRARIYPYRVPGAEADVAYQVRVEGLSFHALLSRSCSWWNPNAEISPAYVLQHEQMHFDIFEIAARRLNREVPGLLEAMDVRGPSEQSVVDGAQRHVQAALARALDETAARNQKFDLETSYGFEPTRQDAWRMSLDRDLRALMDHAAPLEALTPAALGK